MRLHHANLRTVDPVPMVAFYRRLGLVLVGCIDLGAAHTLYLGDPDGGATLELTVREEADPGWRGAPGTGHVAFEVGDVAAVADALVESGVAIEQPPFHPAGRDDVLVAFLRDPDGNHVELVQSPFPDVRDPLPRGLSWED